MEKVKIKLDGGMMPRKGSSFAAAYDLYCPYDFKLHEGRQTVDLCFSLELPLYWKANIRPRSGFSSNGMEVMWKGFYSDGSEEEATVRLDADVLLGLVDCDYRGHVGVTLYIRSLDCDVAWFKKDFKGEVYALLREQSLFIPKGTRFAQMEICRGHETELVEVDELDMSNDRGGGFGHSGTM